MSHEQHIGVELDPNGALTLALGWAAFAQRLSAKGAVEAAGFDPNVVLDTNVADGVFRGAVWQGENNGFDTYLAEKIASMGLQVAVESCQDSELLEHNRLKLIEYLGDRKDVAGERGGLLELDMDDSLELSHWMYALKMGWMEDRDLYEVALEALGEKHQQLQDWLRVEGNNIDDLIYGSDEEERGERTMWRYVAMITSLDDASYDMFVGALRYVLKKGMLLVDGRTEVDDSSALAMDIIDGIQGG